ALGGRDRVDDAEGQRAHGHDVVDVGEDGGETRAPRVAGDERRPQRLPARHHGTGRRGDDGAVVAGPAGPVGVPEDLADQPDVRLRQQPGVGGDDLDDLLELARHDSAHAGPPPSSLIV
ncbi:MAG: hypothetical protein AVDCRST_MAG54-2138, partial [uncultured Actinomycetospora sp.]